MRKTSSSTGEASTFNATHTAAEQRKIDYQKVFEGAPALFLLLGADASFPILDASNAYLRATYTERDTIVGKPLFEVFPDNPNEKEATGSAKLRSSLKRVLADGRPDTMAVQKYDIRRPSSEGGGFEERYWSPVNAPVFGVDGRMLFIVHRVEDVTELAHTNQSLVREGETMRLEMMLRGQEVEEANRQLREASEQFQAMYDQGLFAARLRLDGTVVDINRSAVEVCGFNRADILDRPFWECGWWNRSPEVQAWVRHAVEQAVAGKPFRGESRYFWGDGSEHIVDFACMPIRDAAGRVVVVVPTGMDITERAQAEQNQRALEAERRRVEALAEIDRAKTQFFSNVSHEFRTPLNLILGPIADALDIDEGLAGTQLELVHRNSLRLLKLVNSMLDFSRIEAGRVQMVYAPTDLARLTAELASNFRSACERAGLTLSVDCPPLTAPVHVDRDMWEKIVLNLLSNAFKFTFDGGIGVSLEEKDDGAVLTVRDSGVGIPAAEIDRVFERFYRIEGQRSRTHEGSGIGLALVAELVKLHGGTIAVDSVVGGGTVFTVRIPFGTAHLGLEHVEERAAAPMTSASAVTFVQEALRWLPDGAGKDEPPAEPIVAPADQARDERARIVLADDNADMRVYLTRLLSDAYDVTAVADGEAAFDAIKRERPHVVLTDVMMPRLDGFGLLKQLRADTGLRDTTVLLLSARAGEEAKVEGLQAGADDYLVKPFSARELLARVQANVELARSRRHTASVLRDEARRLRVLNRTANALAAEIELERLVQSVTDAATELTGAQFGAFFYNIANETGESYLLYTISGVPKERFADFPQPRNTAVFGPTFAGEGIVRSGDIRKDPRYGHNAPNKGIPEGHLPVVSYLAVPVASASGEVLGGLFFGHAEADRFTEHHELIVAGIASQAAAAFEKTRLYEASRKAEADLRRLNETLEQRIAEAVAQRMKAEEALRQAQKMEAIGQLTGGVAHDFNNLLQIILGNLETLKRRLSTPAMPTRGDLSRAIEGAIAGAERGATLTHRLLAFSRRQPLDPRPLELNRLVTGMSELLRSTLGETIAIETVLAGGLWRVFADPNQLESAMLNLAVNARDAMPDGGKLTIETGNARLDEAYTSAQPEIQAGQYVMLAVSDTGSGMTNEVIASAFDPFFTTKDIGAGTGLGLSQVYGFVKQSDGHVKIYSEPGEGTTVRIYLPRLAADLEADTVSAPEPAPPASAGECVLLVEDDERVRDLSLTMLQELGYAVVVATDGKSALELLQNFPGIQVLFTDVGLPGINGRELAERARALRPGLKILFTTGYAHNAIVHQGRLDRGIDLLAKPFTLAALALKVRELLDRP